MIVAFSGTVKVKSQDHVDIIEQAIRDLPPTVTEFVSGAAHGVDTIAALMAAKQFGNAMHWVLAPDDDYNEDIISLFHVVAPSSKFAFELLLGKGYMERNDELVARCTDLVAFPKTGTEQTRSGTWSTVRRARKAGRTIHFFPLNGDNPWTETP